MGQGHLEFLNHPFITLVKSSDWTHKFNPATPVKGERNLKKKGASSRQHFDSFCSLEIPRLRELSCINFIFFMLLRFVSVWLRCTFLSSFFFYAWQATTVFVFFCAFAQCYATITIILYFLGRHCVEGNHRIFLGKISIFVTVCFISNIIFHQVCSTNLWRYFFARL